jgi:hypothetical protein
MTVVDVTYHTPTDADIQYIHDHMRESDLNEAYAIGSGTPLEVLRRSVVLSHEATVARVDGVPACLFGLGIGSMLSMVAQPWLIGTPLVERHFATFLRSNRKVVDGWAARYDLETWVDARHKCSLRWMRWLGFEIGPLVEFGPYELPFYRCSRGSMTWQ